MERDYANIPEADVVINYIAARKQKGLYSVIFAAGLPGSGKSSSCLRLMELLSLKLTGKNIITADNIFDDLASLAKFIRDAKPEEINICQVEEVSVLFPSRRAMASDNVNIGKILDTARKKQVIIFCNAPIWTSIDSHLRALGNVYIETLSINKEAGVVVSKALRLQTNPGSGKTYFHWLTRNGKQIQRIITRQPTKETWDKYEDKKDKFMNDLYDKIIFQSEDKAKKEKDKLLKARGGVVKPLTDRETEVYGLSFGKKKSQIEIAEELGLTRSRISRILASIHKKMEITKEKPAFTSTNEAMETIK